MSEPADKRKVVDTIYVEGWRCTGCGYPLEQDEVPADFIADGFPDGYQCPCGGRYEAAASLQAVMLDDGSGPLVVCDCRHHA